MPRDDDIPDGWDSKEYELFDDVLGGEQEIMEDRELQFLFHEAYFDRDLFGEYRATFQDGLEEYLWEEYGIDFDLDFDWDDYRDWYDSQ